MNEATRFKLAVGILALYFVEALITMFNSNFPFIAAIGAEGIVAGYYFTVRTVQDIKQAALDNSVTLKNCNGDAK